MRQTLDNARTVQLDDLLSVEVLAVDDGAGSDLGAEDSLFEFSAAGADFSLGASLDDSPDDAVEAAGRLDPLA